MKTIKFLSFLCFVLMTSFTVTDKLETGVEGYYYFAYASMNKGYDHVYITPLMYMSKKDCELSRSNGENYAISNQFNDYMKAEYKGIIYKCEGSAFNDYTFSKADAEKSRRHIMSLYNSNTKINDFEYLCD